MIVIMNPPRIFYGITRWWTIDEKKSHQLRCWWYGVAASIGSGTVLTGPSKDPPASLDVAWAFCPAPHSRKHQKIGLQQNKAWVETQRISIASLFTEKVRVTKEQCTKAYLHDKREESMFALRGMSILFFSIFLHSMEDVDAITSAHHQKWMHLYSNQE